jgi:hypothetical protein
MLRLAKAFWDLALWRITPEQLPASRFFLALTALALGAIEALGVLLPPSQSDRIVARVLLQVGLPLAYCGLPLIVTRRPERYLQCATAVLGVTALSLLAIYPLSYAVDAIGADQPESLPFALLSIVGLVWWLLACAHIWRAALNSGLGPGIAVSVVYFALQTLVGHLLQLDT